MRIDLHLTPLPLGNVSLENKSAVVIDVLRATTSICAMLVSGARGVIPVAEPGEAAEMWGKLGADMAVLAGEREGVKIDNFDFGNSPLEFEAGTVGEKYVVTSTTNGTAVFGQVAKARLVLTCALVNVSAVARRLAKESRDIVIACAGREGGYSVEDTVCGGMLIDKLWARHEAEISLNDAGSLARLLFRANRDSIQRVVENGEHGLFLQSIGFRGDIELATRIDSMPVVPVFHDGRLRLEE